MWKIAIKMDAGRRQNKLQSDWSCCTACFLHLTHCTIRHTMIFSGGVYHLNVGKFHIRQINCNDKSKVTVAGNFKFCLQGSVTTQFRWVGSLTLSASQKNFENWSTFACQLWLPCFWHKVYLPFKAFLLLTVMCDYTDNLMTKAYQVAFLYTVNSRLSEPSYTTKPCINA